MENTETEKNNLEIDLSIEDESNTDTIQEDKVEMIEKEKYLRLYSDFENYKRRNIKEKEDYFKNANQKIILDVILPILDNFERAGELETGVRLIFDNLKNNLNKYGIKEVESKGLDFNPDIMEAITQISVENMSGKVVDIVEKGYELNGKIIRFAKVVVGS